jgi:hypothetical protein
MDRTKVLNFQARQSRSVFFLKKGADDKAKASTESHISDSPPLKGERLFSVLLLFLLITVGFFPLILGKNLIPFGRYFQWSFMLALSSGQELQINSPAFKRLEVMPWADDPEVASIAINWAENLYFARKLKDGQLPLWDPYAGSGGPTIDNGQSRPFNPFRLPFYFFPTTWMYSLTLLVSLIFGGIGSYLWLSRQGLSPAAVTLGTGLFVLNPWVLDRLVLTDSAAYLVFPWCILTLEQTAWGAWPSIGRAVLCFVLMGHSGHPQVSLVMAGVAASFYLFSKKRLEKAQEGFAGRLKTIGVVAGLTLACLTVLWLPLLRLFLIGDIYKKHAWFIHHHDWRSLVTLPSNMFVAPTIFALLSCTLFAWKKIPKVWMALFTGIVLVFFLLPWIGLDLPTLMTSLGLPSLYLKGVFWASLSFLVAFALDAYRVAKKGAVVAAAAIGGAMLTLTGWQFVSLPMPRNDISSSPAIAFLLLGVGLIALIAFRAARKGLVPVLLSAIVLAPLAFPLSLNKLSWNTVDLKTNSVIEWLRAYLPNARTVSVDRSLLFAIPPNLSQAYGIRCVEIMAVIFINNYWSMFHHPKAVMPTAVVFDFYSPDVFRHMGANILLLSNDVSPNDLSAKDLDLLIKGTQFSAYSISGAHGRLYFAERARQYEPGRDLPNQILFMSRGTDAVAVVEGMGNPVPEVIPEVPSAKGKTVFEMDGTEEVLVRTECPLEGLLVLRDSWYPGWMAFVDGKRTPILRINGCFRGVIVPAGEHKIRFVYRPILVYASGAVTLLTVLLVIFVSLRKNSTQGIDPTVALRS